MPDEGCTPPFTMTEEAMRLVIEIAELVGVLKVSEQLSRSPKLRRENRIRSIQSSLAIEQNTLTVEQVSDVIDGKRVFGPPRDIQEVKNAYEAYEILTRLDPYAVPDLLKAHRIMMEGLVPEAGAFRSKAVGVFAAGKLLHAGPPAEYVPSLIRQLFDWLKKSRLHPLVKSCIFHYEFEFIHPFADGNGRTGRLWHTLILSTWQPFFLWIPIEAMIRERQQGYYQALRRADAAGESTVFVTFMLELIKAELEKIAKEGVKTTSDRVIELLKRDGSLSVARLAEQLGMSSRQVQRIVKALQEDGVIKRHGAKRNGYYEVVS